jgi:hypothetical protein
MRNTSHNPFAPQDIAPERRELRLRGVIRLEPKRPWVPPPQRVSAAKDEPAKPTAGPAKPHQG